jgi:signal transduction histidine kinase
MGGLVLVWSLVAMVYTNRFLPPLSLMEKWLAPWQHLYEPTSEPGLTGRLAHMQILLDRSTFTSNLGLLLMSLSFVALVIYATSFIQQKQRRARENELLLLKNQEIARRNEFIRYISATIGHEFKNNLGRIKRRLDFVDLEPEVKIRIDENLRKLFSDIDIFKRISDEREAGLIVFEKVNVMDMLEDTASKYADMAEIRTEEAVKKASIFASITLLRTVFENIIDNAAKYKKPGQDKALIHLSSFYDSDGPRRYVSLVIRDEGKGMSEPEAENCFYKGRGSGSMGGWGEGLYFAKYVVGLHAGKIRVGMENTAPGKGTEIIIKLPYVEEAIHV